VASWSTKTTLRLNSELAISFNLRMKRGVPLNSTSLALILPSTQLDMEISEPIQCPYCGQSFDLAVDTSTPRQRLITDYEVVLSSL